MKPEDKVATLEQCKKLVELGVELETENVWCAYKKGDPVRNDTPFLMIVRTNRDSEQFHLLIKKRYNIYPAPDVAELGVLLAEANKSIHFNIHFENMGLSYVVKICSTDSLYSDLYYTQKNTEAHVRAEALIWLLENNHIKPEDLK